MKFNRTSKEPFNLKKRYQLPFMKRIVIKSSDPQRLEAYNFI